MNGCTVLGRVLRSGRIRRPLGLLALAASFVLLSGRLARGQGYLVWEASGNTADEFVAGSGSGDQFGSALGRLGDLDGDGVDEIIVGAPRTGVPGAGPDAGVAQVFSGASGIRLFAFSGWIYNFLLGRSVASAGDVNADGIPDILVGAGNYGPSRDGGMAQAGQARVFSLVGLPPSSGTDGAGCAGSSGVVPLIQTLGGHPNVGNPEFAIVLSKALGSANALLIGGPIPFAVPLAPIGLPGCTLLVHPQALIPATTDAAGIGYVPVPVPPVAALLVLP